MPERRTAGRRSTDTRGTNDVQPDEKRVAERRTSIAQHQGTDQRAKGRRASDPPVQRAEVEPDRRHPLHRQIGGKRKVA